MVCGEAGRQVCNFAESAPEVATALADGCPYCAVVRGASLALGLANPHAPTT